jgi:hypothetical protein
MSRRSRQRRRYKVNCGVKREILCTAYAHLYRQVSLHQTNPRQSQLSKLVIQAIQTSKPSIEHATHTIQHRSAPADNKRTNRKPSHKHEQDQTRPNESQTKTKRKPSSKHPSPRTFQTPKPDEYLKENRSMYGDTQSGLPIGERRKSARDRGGGVCVRGSGRVMVSDALPVGKQPPEHEQNREQPPKHQQNRLYR